MQQEMMDLKILLPHKVYAVVNSVTRIVLETNAGFYGLLPHRLDCVAAIEPGILTCESEAAGIQYVATDRGVMVKTGLQVLVSVRNAFGGSDIGKLKELIDQEFRHLDEKERDIRSVMAKLESGFIKSLKELHEE